MFKRIFRWIRRLFRKPRDLTHEEITLLGEAIHRACIQRLADESPYYQLLINHDPNDPPHGPVRWHGRL